MSKYRILSKSKYALPKEDYLTVIHYSLRYPLWLEELRTIADTGKGINYEKERVQSSNNYDQTAETAIRMSEITDRINLIDSTIKLAGGDIETWLRKGVCYGLTFDQLKGQGMPCEKDKYYLARKRYFYELAKKI